MYPTTYRRTFEDLPIEIKKSIVNITEELLHMQKEEKVQTPSLKRSRLLMQSSHIQEKKDTILHKLCKSNVRKIKKQLSSGPLVLQYSK